MAFRGLCYNRRRMKIPRLQPRRGFSTIELLIVVAILLGLTVLAVPLAEMSNMRTREKLLRDALRDTRYAIDRYRAERRSTAAFPSLYPPCIASLLQPIPPGLLKTQGNPGPFLANLPQNPFTDKHGVFFWDIRGSLNAFTDWNLSVSSATTIIPNGVFDIRVPTAHMGDWATAIDGSKYEDW